MNTYKSIVLIALFAGVSIAAPIKKQLAQINTKNLAQVETGSGSGCGSKWDDKCDDYTAYVCPNLTLENPCEFYEGLPGIEDGIQNSLSAQLSYYTSIDISTIPGANSTEVEQSECCSIEEEHEESISCALKTREFCINGSICVVEKIKYSEESKEREVQQGKAQCTTFDVLNNDGSDGSEVVGSGNLGCPTDGSGSTIGLHL
jgi:hypothetical protein